MERRAFLGACAALSGAALSSASQAGVPPRLYARARLIDVHGAPIRALTLARSTNYQNDRTELVFVITPRLAKPLPQHYSLPTDHFGQVGEAAVFATGNMEGHRPATPVPATPAAPVSALPAPAAPGTPAAGTPAASTQPDTTTQPDAAAPADATTQPVATADPAPTPLPDAPAPAKLADEQTSAAAH